MKESKIKMHKDYVCCNKCFKNGQKEKPDVDSKLALIPRTFIHNWMCKTIVTVVIKDFWNGLIYKMPFCCNVYFCKMIYKGLRPSLVSRVLRGEEGDWGKFKLTEKEKEYINKRGGCV